MTVNELKNREDYEFECNICEEYKDMITDEWGCAIVWLGATKGVEYNYCIQDDGTNCSAIYKMEYNEEMDIIDTNYSEFVGYEIDFDDTEWTTSLENAMCQALIDLFDL
jgi:hypothetical protein